MNPDTYFRVNSPDVTNEIIDGEAVIINLVTGNYYSLEGEGAEIWSLLASGATIYAIVDQMTRCYAGDRATISESVLGLALQLQQEQLILVSNEMGVPAVADPPHAHTNGNSRQQFRAPELHKFTDMQELLILDPIHEVDAAGWPHKKTS
jgi:hypothetical protein